MQMTVGGAEQRVVEGRRLLLLLMLLWRIFFVLCLLKRWRRLPSTVMPIVSRKGQGGRLDLVVPVAGLMAIVDAGSRG